MIKNFQQVLPTNEQGQSLVEFLIFLPFLLVFYSITLTMGGAINGSINQQKVTRGYYYNLVQNDSYLPISDVLKEYQSKGVTNAGMFALGWRMKTSGEIPLAPCYKVLSLSNNIIKETCEQNGSGGAETTQYIKVKTIYGTCTATYSLINGYYTLSTNVPGDNTPAGNMSSCLNIQ